MATTPYYCTRQQLVDRLKSAGVLYCADDDQSGNLSTTEYGYVDQARVAASAEIDAALATILVSIPYQQDDASLNEWLKQRCLDLACEWMAERGGGKVPPSLKEKADRARTMLDDVRIGQLRVPGVEYPGDASIDERRAIGRPIVSGPRLKIFRPWR